MSDDAETHGSEVQAWVLGRLDERREELGITVVEWAKRSGVHIDTLNGYLQGRSVSLPALYTLMEPLDITIQIPELVFEKGTTTTKLPEFSSKGMAFVDKVVANFLK